MPTTRPTTLTQIESLLRTIRVDDADEQTLTATTSGLRTCQRLIDSILVAIANRATDLHEDGQAGTAPEVLNPDGQVSGATAAKDAARAGIARQIPVLGLALQNGDISGEHLDHAARHTKGLSDEQRSHLDVKKLADAALSSTPDEFNRKAKHLVDQAKNDWGLGRAIEDRKRSEVSTWHDKATGMGRISAWLDPERFSQFRSLLDAETTALANDRKNDDVLVKKDKHLAADAFMSLIERGATNQSGVTRPVVHLHIDIGTATNGPHEHSTSETAEGFHVPPESLQRFLCDAIIKPVYFGPDGTVLNVGRRSRTATTLWPNRR